MIQWFRKRFPDQLETDDAALAAKARVALKAEIGKMEARKPLWNRWNCDSQIDEFTGPIAQNWRAMEFLLATCSGDPEVPELFSSAWFVQCELALNNKRQMLRGLKEHSAFIQYRYSRYDVSRTLNAGSDFREVTLVDWSKRRPIPSCAARSPHRHSYVGPTTSSGRVRK